MLIRQKPDLTEADVTDEKIYRNRRDFLKSIGLTTTSGIVLSNLAACAVDPVESTAASLASFENLAKSEFSTDEPPSDKDAVTTYINFYEFGLDKRSPVENAQKMKTEPWSIVVEGECNKPGKYTLEDILKPHTLEERIYRFRCVETWAAVIPWVGFSLGDLLKRFEPTGNAKFVQFETLMDPANMTELKNPVLDWPYKEALRMDEAMHPLTLVAVGMYGGEMPKQNGAPIRLAVPWKYGYKSIKSIVKIRFTESMPATAWNTAVPSEYGFYSNVNPEVPHPRWSQAKENRLGEFTKRPTQKFNGYEEQVASLYAGMDLKKYH